MTRGEAIQEVLERDPVCFDCGKGGALELHHVIARSKFGRNRKAECWQVRNLARLCPWCHRLKDKQAGSHTHAARVSHLARLREAFGYDYSDKPWCEYRA
jgi:5-methylcytosine-specific restriction endonuclease McrA